MGYCFSLQLHCLWWWGAGTPVNKNNKWAPTRAAVPFREGYACFSYLSSLSLLQHGRVKPATRRRATQGEETEKNLPWLQASCLWVSGGWGREEVSVYWLSFIIGHPHYWTETVFFPLELTVGLLFICLGMTRAVIWPFWALVQGQGKNQTDHRIHT